MSDKYPFFAAEGGTWKTTAPNPHVDLSGTALTLGTYPVQTFAEAAADTTLDFDDADTCAVTIWKDADNWRRYTGAVWNDETTDNLDLSGATLEGSAGTISADDSVSVVASLPVPAQATDAEILAATETDLRSFSPANIADFFGAVRSTLSVTASGTTLVTPLDGGAYTVQLTDGDAITAWTATKPGTSSAKEQTCSVDFLAPTTSGDTATVSPLVSGQLMDGAEAFTLDYGDPPASVILRSRSDGVVQMYLSQSAS